MTKYDPKKHHRRSIRLKGYDYSSPGAYFVTICTQGRECVLDDPVTSGIVQDVWDALLKWFPTIELDEFVIMPNHVHFVLWIHPSGVGAGLAPAPTAPTVGVGVGAGASPAPTVGVGVVVGAGLAPAPSIKWVIPEPQEINLNPTVGDVVGAFKSLVFKVFFDWVQVHDPARRAKFWQRNYYEHIIRSERELQAIRRYIRQNPDNWQIDRDNCANVRRLPLPKTTDEYVCEAITSNE